MNELKRDKINSRDLHDPKSVNRIMVLSRSAAVSVNGSGCDLTVMIGSGESDGSRLAGYVVEGSPLRDSSIVFSTSGRATSTLSDLISAKHKFLNHLE